MDFSANSDSYQKVLPTACFYFIIFYLFVVRSNPSTFYLLSSIFQKALLNTRFCMFILDLPF